MFRDAAYLPITFPSGAQYAPLSYQTMVGAISRFSQYPAACYRLLQSIAQAPELLSGLPAQRSETLTSTYDSFYEVFGAQLNAPHLLLISPLDTEFDYLLSYWLFRAFDRYVLEDADLLAEMTLAETFTRDYLACVETGTQPRDCASAVDESFSN